MAGVDLGSDAVVRLDAATIQITGIRQLMRDAASVGIAAQDLTDLTYRLAQPIAARAAALAPKGESRRLSGGLKPSKSKTKIMVRVGTAYRLPYAGVVHWGRDGRSGPMFLSRAEEQLRPQTIQGLGEGIADLLHRYNW